MDLSDKLSLVALFGMFYFALQAGLGIALALTCCPKIRTTKGSTAYISAMTTTFGLLGYAIAGWWGAAAPLLGTGAMLVLGGIQWLLDRQNRPQG